MKDLNETTHTAPSAGETGMDADFKKCLKLERDRERSRRESAQGKFEASYQSFDRFLDTFDDPSKAAVFSDGGAGEERIVAGCDGDGGTAYYRTCVKRAMNRLRGRPELQKTLHLIVKHGNRREDSIWAILASRKCPTWDAARKQYFAHLEKLLNIFCGQ